MKLILALGAAMALSASAFAQITPIGPFTGSDSENFDTGPQVIFTACMPNRVFNNTADMCTPGGSGCHTTTGWQFYCTIFSYSAPRFYGSAGGLTEITFDTTFTQFGGYFGTNSNVNDGVAEFYDANGGLIGTAVITAPANCTWNWNGWQLATAAKSVKLINNSYGGAFLDMDDLEVIHGTPPPPPPSYYCTAGTSTTGCSAQINASAQPSASLSTPCLLTLSNVSPQQSGIIFYGVNNTGFLPLQWALGSTSYLCVKSPIQRSPAQNAGGTPGQCDGQIVLDWNVLHNTFPGLLGTPFAVGEDVYAQGWYRDPPAPKTTNLSNAVELTIIL